MLPAEAEKKKMKVAQLLGEHRRILVVVGGLEALVAGPRPDRVDRLSTKRWAFTRDLLLHFSHVETWVHAPLLADRRDGVARAAALSREQTVTLVRDFEHHAARWHGFPAPAQWGEYALVIDHLMGRIRARLAWQERSLYPLLPAEPGDRGAAIAPVNYAAEAWKIRELIYGKDGLPIAEHNGARSLWPPAPALAG
jgi:hypothetical protein